MRSFDRKSKKLFKKLKDGNQMNLDEILNMQKEFDEKHETNFNWNKPIDQKNLDMLGFILMGIVGEVGELANIIKKILRGDDLLESKRTDIEEEIADIFIYLMKFCNQMKIDLEGNYLLKLKKNKKRFLKYKSK